MAKTSENDNKKGFKVIDAEKGIFELYDSIYEERRRWKISDDSRPGISVLMNRMEKDATEATDKADMASWSKMSKEERETYEDRIKLLAQKQLAIMASFLEPLDPIPPLLDNKLEYLAACLTSEKDAAKINAFFLMRSAVSTTSAAGFRGKIQEIMESL